MIDLTRLGRALGVSVGVAAGLAGIGLAAALRRPLPRVSGRAALPGLAARAEVRRDRWGVPHIYADNNADLFSALGYVHGQDRLWQMELNRRTGHGQLAEIFGPIALSSDRFIRTLGFSRIARQEVELLDDQSRTIVEAYLRGVNAFVEANRSRLPLEFSLLGIQPRPWDLADVLVWPKIMALSLSCNWMSELLHARLVATLGAERFSEIFPHYPEHGRVTVPADATYTPTIGGGALAVAQAASRFTGAGGPPQGSNAWVVGGERTVSGQPLLSDDPHLNLSLPGIWYLAHLEGGDFHVTGGTMPGACGVVIGHNRRIAWGVTNAATDNQDLYIERFDPVDQLRYQWKGEWLQAELAREEIAVKGQAAPTVVEVRVTRHGPIIDDISGPILQADPQQRVPHSYSQSAESPAGARRLPEALALRWTALDPSPTLMRAVLGLNQAGDWESFRAALADWDVPPQNFVYADRDGHIGYTLAGRLPLRAEGEGLLPVPGWDGHYEWAGFIPHEDLPFSFDPPAGLAVTANNKIVAPTHPYHDKLSGEWASPYRAERITELLAATPRHDLRSFAGIQIDVRSQPGLRLAGLVANISFDNPQERKARDLLVAWDGELRPESAAGTIYSALRHHLLRVVYAEIDDLSQAAAGLGAFAALPSGEFLDRALPELIDRIAAADLDAADPWLGGGRSWGAVLRESMSRAVAELRRLGNDPARWTYGRVHSMTLRHPLGGVAALAPVFNRGPWPTGGDIDTVNQNFIPRDMVAGPVYRGPSYRQIIDLSDWDVARVVIPAGQSGHPASRHYSDQGALWRAGGHIPMLFSREAVERHTVATLSLEPREG